MTNITDEDIRKRFLPSQEKDLPWRQKLTDLQDWITNAAGPEHENISAGANTVLDMLVPQTSQDALGMAIPGPKVGGIKKGSLLDKAEKLDDAAREIEKRLSLDLIGKPEPAKKKMLNLYERAATTREKAFRTEHPELIQKFKDQGWSEGALSDLLRENMDNNVDSLVQQLLDTENYKNHR